MSTSGPDDDRVVPEGGQSDPDNGGSISEEDLVINFTGVSARPREDRALDVLLETTRGVIPAILHACEGEDGVVMFIAGGRELKGPADGLYERLATEFMDEGITSLRLGERRPGVFIESVGDVLAGLSFLKGIGAKRVVLVGHSFNGAVAIKAAEFSEMVVAVGALSAQTYGAQDVAQIAPRDLLIVHGMNDDVLSHEDAQRIYDWAKEPKEIVLYPGANHGLREVKEPLYVKLKGWLMDRVGPPDGEAKNVSNEDVS
jgi:alpha/beta superfamily hydrolase